MSDPWRRPPGGSFDEGKLPLDVSSLIPEDIRNPERRKRLIDYCSQDARLTKRLGKGLVTELEKVGIRPKTLLSKASVSEKHFRGRCFIPTINQIPDEVLDLAWRSYRGGWFEVFSRGYHSQIYEYDLNSAYPAQISDLADISRGKWVVNSNYEPKAHYGYIWARVVVARAPSPIPLMWRGQMVFPTGEFETVLTKGEFDLVEQELGTVLEIKQAAWWFPDELRKPFWYEVNRLYGERRRAQSPLMQHTLKLLLNSLYGKFLQKRPIDDRVQTGNLFNPIYASEICARTRLVLYRAMPKNGSLVSVATDSIITSEALDLEDSRKLGAWKHEVVGGEMVALGSGIYTVREGEEIMKRKNRCFKSRLDLFSLLREHERERVIPLSSLRVVTPGDIWGHARPLWEEEDLNCFRSEERTLDINFDRKRIWMDQFGCSGEVLERNISSIAMDTRLMRALEEIR